MFIKDYNKTALIIGDTKISFAEVIEKVRQYSTLIDISRGERCAIFFENRPEWVYAFFAGWNTGVINVPIDMMSTAGEVTHIINDCTPKLVFTSDKNLPRLTEALKKVKKKPRIVNVDHLPKFGNAAKVKDYSPDMQEIVLLLYTSGTTGKSKGVMLSYENLWVNVRWNNDNKRVNIDDTMIAILPFHHSWPLMATLLCPMDCGSEIVFIRELNADEIMTAMKKNHVTMITAVPRLFEMFHRAIVSKINRSAAARTLLAFCRVIHFQPLCRVIFGKVHKEFGGNIKVFISGGAKLDEGIIRDYRAMGILMVEGYGMTESAPMITWHPYDAQRIGSTGKVFEKIDYQLEEDGELLVRGPNIMKGYWNRPEETAAVLQDGWLRTGDLAYVDKDRYLYITGRKKDLIILPNGKNIRPDLIEQTFRDKFDIIEEIAVTEKDSKLYAIIRPNLQRIKETGVSNIVETFKWKVVDTYNQSVENYKKIHDFVVTNRELPKTRMGKIKRFELKEFIEEREKPVAKQAIPKFEEYGMLAAMIEELTGAKPQPGDHIEIDLGLDSLSLIELQLMIEKSFGVVFKEGELTNHPTLEKLAETIRDRRTRLESEAMDWAELLNRDINLKMPRRIWMLSALHLGMRILLAGRLKVSGKGMENIPDGPCIFAPNHESFLDTLVLVRFLPKAVYRKTFFFAKDKNFKIPFGKTFAKNSHVILMDINRDLVLSLQKIAKVLRSQNNMVIFPEGARTRDGKLQNFKKTFAILSRYLDIPVVPVAINGTREAMPVGKTIPGRGTVTVEFLPAIYPKKRDENKIATLVQKAVSDKVH